MSSKKSFFFLGIYKMVVKITKETWKKSGIETVKQCNEKENIIELWQNLSDIEIQLGHSIIGDVALKRIRKYYCQKTKNITEEEKEKYKAFFEGETGIFIFEKITCTRDIIKRCKLAEAIELRKKLRYNHADIMVPEETSIAEKIINFFLTNIMCLIKNLKTENHIFGLQIIILLLKLMKEIMKIMNPNDSSFDLFKFAGKISLYIRKITRKKYSKFND